MADERKVGIQFEDVQSASGVDLTLIEEQLKLTPAERLRWLEKAQRDSTPLGCPGIFSPDEWQQILIADEALQLQEMREILDAYEAERLLDETGT